jgi:hypothetical protein
MPIIRVGVQAPTGSTGQSIDFDGGDVATSLTITNNGTEGVQYTTDGTNWTTVAAAGSASLSTVSQGLFRLRKASAGAYPAPVDVNVTASDSTELNGTEVSSVRALVSADGNLYNATASNTKLLQREIAKACSGGIGVIGGTGDSTMAGFGATTPWAQSDLVQMLNMLGVPVASVLAPLNSASGTDPRIALVNGGGTWTAPSAQITTHKTISAAASATATFQSTNKGTSLRLWYPDNQQAFNYAVDGGADVPITPSNTGIIGTQTISGLSDATHSVVYKPNVANGGAFIGFECVAPSGMRVLNVGVGGMRSAGLADTGFRAGTRLLVSMAAPVVFIRCTTNDIGDATAVATSKANMQSAITYLQGQSVEVHLQDGYNNGAFADQTSQDARTTMLMELAVTNQIPLFYTRAAVGSYADANALTRYADTTHPNTSGYGVGGRRLAGAYRIWV